MQPEMNEVVSSSPLPHQEQIVFEGHLYFYLFC